MTPTHVIGDYSAANSIDGAAYYLLIQPGGSSTAYNKINRNTLLGVTGQPMDTSTTQTVDGKILTNTNSLTLKDTNFTLQDDGDTTKQVQFQLSGITTATTRTLTVPNISGTIVTDNSTVTLTNKTLTSPAITGGTIDQSTITVDSIAGHTTANTGTIYGLTVTTGTLGTTALAAGAVQASQLATNAITLGYVQITGNITTTSTSQVQATGLTATVTIPSGNRRIKITVYTVAFANATTANGCSLSLWDGTVGSGTQIQSLNQVPSTNTFACMIASVTPAAGSKTYNVGFASVSSGTTTISAGSTSPAFILVEAI